MRSSSHGPARGPPDGVSGRDSLASAVRAAESSSYDDRGLERTLTRSIRAAAYRFTAMARDWEETFTTWYGPASDDEQTRYENTRKAIDEALRDDPRLADYTFDVYVKGSYPAYTNVVRDSDVDVAAELTSFNSNEFKLDAEGLTLADVGVTPYTGNATLPGFKDDVEAALVDAFGAAAVDRGNKAIHISEFRRSLQADVVPCVTHRTWLSRTSSRSGTRLQHDARRDDVIVNYPKQHLDEGTRKNGANNLRYKRVVRILKRLENEMTAKDVIEAVPSFLIESAVYNVPNDYFNGGTWTARIRAALAYIYEGTSTDACVASNDWLEVSRCKFLFASGQSWTRETANDFTLRAWGYLGLGS